MQSKPESAPLMRILSLAALQLLIVVGFACVLTIALNGCDNKTRQNESAATPSVQKAKPAKPKPQYADAATLRKRVVDHTFTGQMGPAVVTEFYAPGGVIHGGGYRAQWRIDNDRLCVNYDEAPHDDCYDVRFDGDIMRWLRNGDVGGEGVLVKGNPNHL